MEKQFLTWYEHLWPWFLDHGIKIIVILIAALLLSWLVRVFIRRAIRISLAADKTATEIGRTKRERTLVRIFTMAVRIFIFLIAIMMVVKELGVEIGPLLAGAGIIGLAVGFGAQYLIRDIIAGMFIILENQYRIGDVVRFDNISGLVEDITLRMTTLRDLDGTVHHFPHGEIKHTSNFSKTFSRVNLDVGIAYDANLDRVIEVVNRTGKELAADPAWKDYILTPPQFLRVEDFGDSAVVIKIFGDTQPIRQWEVTGELRKRLKIAFDREGITIPFPQRVVHSSREKEK